jgi:hypothetical protein
MVRTLRLSSLAFVLVACGSGEDVVTSGTDIAPVSDAAAAAEAASALDARMASDATSATDATVDVARSDAVSDAAARDADASGTPPEPTIVGAYVGNSTQSVLDHEAWLGKAVDAVLGYTGAASWADYDGSVGWAAGASMWGALDRRILWSVPLIPTGADLASAGSGTYDTAHYKPAATTLAAFRPSEPVLYVRTAWELNGNWFPWQCTQASCLADFIAAWRHFVTTFRAASSRFRFDWCPNVGQANATYALEDSYPGDDYVDVIGLDLYAGWYPNDKTTPEDRWQYELTRPYGLQWLASFAQTHGKPISLAEWGVGDNGSGDDPVFVQGMHDFCEANHCVYMTYWDSNSAYKGELRNGQYPNAAARYKTLFGKP